MEEKRIRPNSPKAWMLAARPKTLAGAAVPVMIGLASAYKDSPDIFSAVPAVLCVLFAFIMQIDANFINDYFDFVRGNDDESRLGPRRACSQGWITARAMRIAMLVTTVSACIIGLPLVLYGGMEMILIGGLCVLFCYLYTTTLSYLGLGDLLVIVFFGIVPVCITYYIQTGTVTTECLLFSVACGLVIDSLLLINNYRDIDNDTKAGKKTLAVRLGAAPTRIAYLIVGIVAVVINVLTAIGQGAEALLPCAYLPFHFVTYRQMVCINKGKALNAVLGKTARNMFIYGIFVSVAILLNN